MMWRKVCFNFATTAKTKSKTYYQILQLPITSTLADIRKNYLRLAKVYHPDVYKGKDKTRFQKIQQAYNTLSDKIKKKQYDIEIGVKQQSKGDDGFRQQASKIHPEKPQNPLKYDEKLSQKQQINIDEEYNKFFNQKNKTQFEQIILNQQPEVRSMSENQRVRRKVTELFESNESFYKAQYQNKTYSDIIDDQIDQKNQHHKDQQQQKSKTEQKHSEKGIKKSKIKIYIITAIFTIFTFPMMMSWLTKYKLERQNKQKYLEKMQELQKNLETLQVRDRFLY